MSDDLQHGTTSGDHNDPADKRETARRLAEAAQEARLEGDTDRADELSDRAERTDPEAAAEVLEAGGGSPVEDPDVLLSDAERDAKVAAISRTIQPKSDAPSRSNITGSGSGADNS